MKNEAFRNNLKWIAAAGQIERYPMTIISDKLKNILRAVVYGAAVGFLIGFLVGINV